MEIGLKWRVATTGLSLALLVSASACSGEKTATNANANANTNRMAPPPANTAPPTNTAAANDTAIKNSVEANLTKYNVKGVTVTVSNGEVTLTGTVPAADFQKAVQAANEATPKPAKVNNQLTKS